MGIFATSVESVIGKRHADRREGCAVCVQKKKGIQAARQAKEMTQLFMEDWQAQVGTKWGVRYYEILEEVKL